MARSCICWDILGWIAPYSHIADILSDTKYPYFVVKNFVKLSKRPQIISSSKIVLFGFRCFILMEKPSKIYMSQHMRYLHGDRIN